MSEVKKGLIASIVLFWIVMVQLLILNATTNWNVSSFWVAQYWVAFLVGYVATAYIFIQVK